MFLIVSNTEEGLDKIVQANDLKRAHDYMLRRIIEICIEEYGTEDFCDEYVAENDPHYDDESYEIEYFDTFDELQDAGLLNDYCEFLDYDWNVKIFDNYCYLDLDDGTYYEIKIFSMDSIEQV